MLVFEGYGVTLKRLSIEDIELVRYWRNADKIKQYMEFREEITPEMQLNWFQTIDDIHNFYFLIKVNNAYIGLINGSGTDWQNGITGSGGIFIWDDNYISTEVPFNASVLITDLSFALGMRVIYSRILRDNEKSIIYNKNLGYSLLPGQDEVYNQQYELTEKNYMEATKSVRTILNKHYGEQLHIRFIGPLTDSEQAIYALFADKKVPGHVLVSIEKAG